LTDAGSYSHPPAYLLPHRAQEALPATATGIVLATRAETLGRAIVQTGQLTTWKETIPANRLR